jgi:hypothetical protein
MCANCWLWKHFLLNECWWWWREAAACCWREQTNRSMVSTWAVENEKHCGSAWISFIRCGCQSSGERKALPARINFTHSVWLPMQWRAKSIAGRNFNHWCGLMWSMETFGVGTNSACRWGARTMENVQSILRFGERRWTLRGVRTIKDVKGISLCGRSNGKYH